MNAVRSRTLTALACLAMAAAVPAAAQNVAVLDFKPNNVSAGEAAVVSGFVRRAMVNDGTFDVVDKNNMDRILNEQAFQQTGCTSQECAVKLGKLLNVHLMVVGEYSVLEGTKFLTAQLVDVESGKIQRTGTVKEFAVSGADIAAADLVNQLTGKAVASVPAAAPAAEPPIWMTFGSAERVRGRVQRARFAVGAGVSNFAVRQTLNIGRWDGSYDKKTSVRVGFHGTASYRFPILESGVVGLGVGGGLTALSLDKSGGGSINLVVNQLDGLVWVRLGSVTNLLLGGGHYFVKEGHKDGWIISNTRDATFWQAGVERAVARSVAIEGLVCGALAEKQFPSVGEVILQPTAPTYSAQVKYFF